MVSKKEQLKVEKISTFCTLKSKANYTITVIHKDQNLLIPPFGSVNVIKEDTVIDLKDSRHLTFIKK